MTEDELVLQAVILGQLQQIQEQIDEMQPKKSSNIISDLEDVIKILGGILLTLG